MLSRDLRSLRQFLNLAATGAIAPNRGSMLAAERLAKACIAEAEHLEAQIIPRRQRLTDEHLASGKVRLLGVIPRNEAFL